MNKIAMIIVLIILALVILAGWYVFFTKAPIQKNIVFGVNFSKMQAEALGLNWKEAYLALITDLGVKNIKLLTQWNAIEDTKDTYSFEDTDWMLAEAQARGVNVIYVVGMKSGRWPECHVPVWAEGLSKAEQQEEILAYVTETVVRYKDNPAITVWQAENEPLFRFGQCPWYDKDFLKKEVALIKSLDPSRKVMVSDSGEQSLWLGAGSIGDQVGVTMYRTVWFHVTDKLGFYTTYPLPPVVYYRKAQLINKLFGKQTMCVELQAEPWASRPFQDVSLEEQAKTMNPELFKATIEYAKKTGFSEFYLWGGEWWYWLKETKQSPDMWNEAKKLF